MEKAQILIVEDDAIIAMDLESRMKQLGYGVTAIVGYGKQAIEKAKENKPNVVLMDIILKGEIDGIEAAEEIRTQYDIPVIFITGYADKERLKRAKLTYPFGFIIKPFQDKDLEVTIEMALYVAKADAERKQSEKSLQESEEIHRITLANISDAVFLTDDTGVFTFICPNVDVIFGYSEEEVRTLDNISKLLGDNYYDPNELEALGEIINTEIEIIDKAGKKHDLLVNVKGVSIKGGTKLITCRDITERKQAEGGFKKSEEKYRILFEIESDALLLVDVDTGDLLEANEAACKLYGYSHEELVGLKELDLSAEPEKTKKAIKLIEKTFLPLRYHKKKDGTVFPVEINANDFTLDGKKIIFCAIRDITERKQAEETLRESEERYRLLTENAKDMIYRMSLPDGRYEYVSPASRELFGNSPEEFYNSPLLIQKAIHPDWHNYFEEQWNALIKGEMPPFYEYQIVNKSGEVKWLHQRNVLVRDKSGQPVAIEGIVTDITDRKRTEQELIKAKKLESVGILAGGIAHDFNNLLSIIMGNISMTKDDVKPEYGVTEFLNEAEKASQRAQELTNQLITFSKGGAPVKKTGSIEDLVKETTNFALSGSNIKSDFFFPDDLWLVDFDKGQIKHALKNLIDNAVESMPDGGTIDVRAENRNITAKKDLPLPEGKYVKISIRDHGVGIPDEHLSKIFDPYFSTKEKGIQKGMGLGLATTYSIISRHDGHINAESEVGVGTTFTIYLPVAVKEIVGIEPVKMAEPEKAAVRTGRILVMDDEEAIRNLSRQVLSRLGYEPGLAKDGAEAIELYKRALDSGKPFDAVILDLTIKGSAGGKEVIKQLMKIDPDIKAIVSSGYSNDPAMTNFRAYGFIGALPKPYPMKDLKDMLNQVLGKS